MSNKSWNPVLNLVSQIKEEYIKTYGYPTNIFRTSNKAVYVDNKYSHSTSITCLEKWILNLNNPLYLDWIKPLQITQYDNLILIRYALIDMNQLDMAGNMWDWYDGIYRECRSVVIDVDMMELVLTPFAKFFNVNERDETKLEVVQEKIKTAKLVEFSDKLDGSMQSASWYNCRVIMSGSQSLDSRLSWRLDDGYNWLISHKGYVEMLKENPEWTFIFEWISLKDAHVVNYTKEQEGLYLIGMRSKGTGVLLSRHDIWQITKQYEGILLPECNQGNYINECLEQVKTAKSNEKEGWVIRVDDNLYKLKVDDYVAVHKILDKVSSINVIIKNIADGTYDDLISKVPDVYRYRVEKIANLIFDYVKDMNVVVEKLYSKNYNEDRKGFMIAIQEISSKYKGYLINKYLGKEVNYLKSNSGSYKKLKDMGISCDYSALFSNEE